jgi:hypothetical protein
VKIQSIQTKKNKTKQKFTPKFDKYLGCYRLPPLKEISSPGFGEARKKEGFGLPRWLPPLKGTFVGSLGPWVQQIHLGLDLALGHLL